MSIPQWTKSDSITLASSLGFVVFGKKAKAHQATRTFALRSSVGEGLAARSTNPNRVLLRINDVHEVKTRYT
jgi:hypothetical protein